jgi:sec-independent protein translocase protein TatA
MGSFSIWHWMIVIVVVLLLFGRGKIANVMGDLATGIKSFKKGMADDDTPAPAATAATRVEDARTAPIPAPPQPQDTRPLV